MMPAKTMSENSKSESRTANRRWRKRAEGHHSHQGYQGQQEYTQRHGHNGYGQGHGHNGNNIFNDTQRSNEMPAGEIAIDMLRPTEKALICRAADNPLLPMLGIRPGKLLTMVTCQPFGGPYIVKMNGRCVAISRQLARRIFVQKNTENDTGVRDGI